MCPDSQFWWNLGVNAAVALGTIATVFVALFGQLIRSKLFPPRLTLRLVKPEGENGKERRVVGFERGEPHDELEDVRYYHLKVSNERRRCSPANMVQVFLIRTEEPGPDGKLQITWTGDVPMRWRDQELFPLARTIGRPADCDLCCVGKGKWLELRPLKSHYSLNVKRQEKSLIVLSLQARANEADSDILRVQIAWDGGWEEGAQEMKRHLIVSVNDVQMA
jgi:hypothetical protein